jgi:hypothetical protein
MGMPEKPIIAAVMTKGMTFGTIETRIIRKEENKNAMSIEIIMIAIITLSKRLRIRKLVPLA